MILIPSYDLVYSFYMFFSFSFIVANSWSSHQNKQTRNLPLKQCSLPNPAAHFSAVFRSVGIFLLLIGCHPSVWLLRRLECTSRYRCTYALIRWFYRLSWSCRCTQTLALPDVMKKRCFSHRNSQFCHSGCFSCRPDHSSQSQERAGVN